jgi:hypothetical protein
MYYFLLIHFFAITSIFLHDWFDMSLITCTTKKMLLQLTNHVKKKDDEEEREREREKEKKEKVICTLT